MAELELSVRYRTLPNKVGFALTAAMFPVWALLVPYFLGLFIVFLIRNPGALPPDFTSMMLLMLSAVPILGVLISALFEDDRLYVTKSGISFPLYLVPFLGFRRNRSWAELAHVGIKRDLAKSSDAQSLRLSFQKTIGLEFAVKNFDRVQLEQFLLATELWAAKGARSPELADFQRELQNENKGIGKISQLQVFEEELARRFNATSFVPLEPNAELANGTIKIVRQLAFGGLSAIYLAQQNHRNLVVLKEAVIPFNADEETMRKAEEHFVREARLLMVLDHPNIAKVYSHFREDGRDYMVMQYIKGQDLRQLVKQQGTPLEDTIIEWGIQIGQILHYLHNQKPPILHRDLTPDNLVLNENGDVILIDFGAANVFVGTATGTLVGKQSYMPPEQLRGKSSTASDLYALGGTLHYLLTGKDPVPLAVSHPLKERPELSGEVDDIVARLTAFEPQDRFESAMSVIETLRHIRKERLTGDDRSSQALPGGVS